MAEGMKAPLYKFHKDRLSRAEFTELMKSLPVEVADEEVEEMFTVADLNKDGSIGMAEFSLMVGILFRSTLNHSMIHFNGNSEFLFRSIY